jgi:hypothetical protein
LPIPRIAQQPADKWLENQGFYHVATSPEFAQGCGYDRWESQPVRAHGRVERWEGGSSATVIHSPLEYDKTFLLLHSQEQNPDGFYPKPCNSAIQGYLMKLFSQGCRAESFDLF